MLIGISGDIGAGKDTSADYLVEKHGFTKRAFAYPLKQACKELFLLTDEQVYTNKEKPDERWFGCKPRTMLQYVGSELLRDRLSPIIPELGKDIFIRNLELWLKEHPDINVVVPDVRFVNEIELIERLGGKVVRIERKVDFVSNHVSETTLRNHKFECVIENNGTKEELYKKIDELLKVST